MSNATLLAFNAQGNLMRVRNRLGTDLTGAEPVTAAEMQKIRENIGATATAITLGVLNVVDYGAEGDGSTVDTDSVVSALDAGGSGSVKVILCPAGNYRLESLTVPAGLTLRMEPGAQLVVDSGETVTVEGGFEARAVQAITGGGSIRFACGAAVGDIYPQWWGAKGDGVNDDTAAIQAAIDAAIYIAPAEPSRRAFRRVRLPAGEYRITNTLSVVNALQLVVEGDSGATTLRWDGPDNVPAIRMINGYMCEYRNFRILEAGAPLKIGFEQYTDLDYGGGYTHPGTRNRYININIEALNSQVEIGWRIGGRSGGLLGVDLGDDANNDFTRWDDCKAQNVTECGWNLEGFNCFENLFVNCLAFGAVGSDACMVSSWAANFHWIRGACAYFDTVFRCESTSSAVYVCDGLDVELSGRLLDAGGLSGAAQNWQMLNIRFAPTNLKPDGQVIIYKKAGWLRIDGLICADYLGSANARFNLQSTDAWQPRVTLSNSIVQCDDGNLWVVTRPHTIENVVLLANSRLAPLDNRSAQRLHDFYGTIKANGGVRPSALTALQPTVFKTGASGAATWGYKVTVLSDVGESLPCAEVTVANCPSTLSVSNYITIRIDIGSVVPGAKAYKIYRTTSGGTPASTGLIATLTDVAYGDVVRFVDDGSVTATGAVPTVDTSAALTPFAIFGGFNSGVATGIILRNSAGNIGCGNGLSFRIGTDTEVARIDQILDGISQVGLSLKTFYDGALVERFRLKARNINIPLSGLPAYANNAAAITGGLVAGDLYRTNGDPDLVCVVH